jgi:hypothetical protein
MLRGEHRLQLGGRLVPGTADQNLARTLSAWMITGNATIAALTTIWSVLASLVGPRPAIAVAGLLLLATPFLLRFPKDARRDDEELEAGRTTPSPQRP